MLRYLTPLAVLALSACKGPTPCMTIDEVGTIVASEDHTDVAHSRLGPYNRDHTTVTVEVKGVSRVCKIDEHAAEQLKPGMKVSLINAGRKY